MVNQCRKQWQGKKERYRLKGRSEAGVMWGLEGLAQIYRYLGEVRPLASESSRPVEPCHVCWGKAGENSWGSGTSDCETAVLEGLQCSLFTTEGSHLGSSVLVTKDSSLPVVTAIVPKVLSNAFMLMLKPSRGSFRRQEGSMFGPGRGVPKLNAVR